MFAAVLVLGVSACGSKGEEGSGTSSAPITSTGAETLTGDPAETEEPSTSEGQGEHESLENDGGVGNDGVGESGDTVEETTEAEDPLVEENYFGTETFQTLIDDLTAKYSNMEEKQVQAAILVANYDHITKEDWDTLLDSYAFSEEELNNQFKAFVESYQADIWRTALYCMDRSGGDKEAYNRLIKFDEVALTDEDRTIAEKYDKVFAINASANYRRALGDFYEFDNFISYEVGCKRLLYFIVMGIHPEQFDDVSNVFIK